MITDDMIKEVTDGYFAKPPRAYTAEELGGMLKGIKRYRLSAGSLDPYTSCIGEEEDGTGDWIKAEDIDALAAFIERRKG